MTTAIMQTAMIHTKNQEIIFLSIDKRFLTHYIAPEFLTGLLSDRDIEAFYFI